MKILRDNTQTSIVKIPGNKEQGGIMAEGVYAFTLWVWAEPSSSKPESVIGEVRPVLHFIGLSGK